VAVSVHRISLTVTLSGVLLVSTAVGVAAQVEKSTASVPERVLFIGNSHTQRHGGVDWLVANMVAAENPARAFEGASHTASGVTLEYHYQNGAGSRIRSGGFDTVVLQGYLPGSVTRTAEPFLEHARLLDEEIEQAGARTVFYMTWPQGRFDWADLDDFVDAHRRISEELDAPVAPVGVAMQNARAQRPDIQLIGDDEVHATWEGAYLAAATIYATLFDRSPEGLAFAFGVSDEDAAFLQRVAWQTVTDWQAGEPATNSGSRADPLPAQH